MEICSPEFARHIHRLSRHQSAVPAGFVRHPAQIGLKVTLRNPVDPKYTPMVTLLAATTSVISLRGKVENHPRQVSKK